MKILGHIHTFNDEDVIDRSLGAMLSQTRPLDEILVVDNASTDGTLERTFPPAVKVIKNSINLGTSGAVAIGLRYAMESGFDWAWIMDGDSAPYPDALERLMELWQDLPEPVRERTWRLSTLPLEKPRKAVTAFSMSLVFYEGTPAPKPHHGQVFTDRGYYQVDPKENGTYYECDATIWGGCLYRLDAVRKIGFPSSDYVLDIGEYEYGYRGKRNGHIGIMDQRSLLLHNIRGQPSFHFTAYRFGPLNFQLMEMAPIRCYYTVRNMLYFWVYEFRPVSVRAILLQLGKLLVLTLNFTVRPWSRRMEFAACIRGFWHGLCKNMAQRY